MASILSRSVLALGLALAVAPAVVHAQKDGKSEKEKKKLAKQYVDAALAAEGAGDYDQAVELYEKAYETVPHPILLFDIGEAQRKAGRDEQALDAYLKYLEADPKGPKAKEAQTWVDQIQPGVERARAAVAEAERKAADAEAARKAAEDKQAEAERQRQEAELARKRAEAEAEPEEEPAPSGGGRKKLGLIVGGSGIVLAGVGTVFGVLAIGAWGDATDLCGDDLACDSDADTATANALADDARLRGNVATVLVGVGAAALVTGAILYLTAPSGGGGGDEHALLIAPTHGGALVTWSGAL